MKYSKLPKAFKRKWVAALRSGKYKQGTVYLYYPADDAWCCLGVACAVAGYGAERVRTKLVIESSLKLVPKELHAVNPANVDSALSKRNDSGKWSFRRIATWIEKYL